MTQTDDIHNRFPELLEALITGGLTPEAAAEMEAHAATCAACTAALNAAREADASLRALFAAATPDAGFEDRLIAGLRSPPERRWVHPFVLRAASGVAAAVLLGAVGYFGPNFVARHGHDRVASRLLQGSPATHPSGNVDFVIDSIGLQQKTQVAGSLPGSLALYAGENRGTVDRKSPDAFYRQLGAEFGEPGTAYGRSKSNASNLWSLPVPASTPQSGATGFGGGGGSGGFGTSPQDAGLAVKGATIVHGGATDHFGVVAPIDAVTNQPKLPAVNGTAAYDTALGLPPVTLADKDASRKGDNKAMYFTPPTSGDVLDEKKGERQLGRQEARDLSEIKRLPDAAKPSAAPAKNDGMLMPIEGMAESAQSTRVKLADNLGKSVTYADKGVETPPSAPVPPAVPALGNAATTPTTQAAADSRKIIRTGQMEFEVDSFDSAFIQITKISAEESGFVASTDSEKLANGKVRGTITLRCAPEHLDTLVLKLRGLGDLKTQRIAAQDVTKQFTDFESELKAARAMESRMLDIIKTGKGTVKDLVEAEKQLGVYREKIEHIEGELRFMGSQVALSTLNITLMERDIRTPFAALETEQINAGIEAEDVEKARADALKLIDDAKGRVIESDLKKLDAGQLAATIVAEVAPDVAGPLGDKLKQLGRVARWDAERKQVAQGGTGAVAELRPTAKLERQATRFSISLYNLANIAPRQTTSLTLVATDVEAAYKTLLATVNGDGKTPIGRIVTSNLSAQKSDQVTGSITLEVKTEQAAQIEAALRTAGSVLHLAVTENPDQNGVTTAKRGYSIALIAAINVPARETQNMAVAAKDVPTTYNKLLTLLRDPKQSAHVINSQLVEQEEDNVSGSVDFEIPAANRIAVETVLADGKASDIVTRNVARSADTENTLADKLHVTVTIASADRLPPREMTRLTLEASDVQKTLDTAAGLGGSDTHVLERTLNQEPNGKSTAHVVLDVPMANSQATLDQLRGLGKVRAAESTKNPKVIGGPLARARFEVELANTETLVAPEEGVGYSVRVGLRKALGGLLWSVQMVVIGLVLVGPFVLVAWIGVKLFRRSKRKTVPASA